MGNKLEELIYDRILFDSFARLYAEDVLGAAAPGQVDDAGQREQLAGRQQRRALAQRPLVGVERHQQPDFVGAQPLGGEHAEARSGPPAGPVRAGHPEDEARAVGDQRAEVS